MVQSFCQFCYDLVESLDVMDEPHHEKTCFLGMRKQRRSLAVKLISAFVFVT